MDSLIYFYLFPQANRSRLRYSNQHGVGNSRRTQPLHEGATPQNLKSQQASMTKGGHLSRSSFVTPVL